MVSLALVVLLSLKIEGLCRILVIGWPSFWFFVEMRLRVFLRLLHLVFNRQELMAKLSDVYIHVCLSLALAARGRLDVRIHKFIKVGPLRQYHGLQRCGRQVQSFFHTVRNDIL